MLAAACGSSSGGSILSPTQTQAPSQSQATFDVKRADAMAHAAVIGPADLPGFTWDVLDDKFDEETAGKLKPCTDLVSLADEETKARLGRASRRLTRSVANTSLRLNVSGIVEIYPTAAQAKALFDGERALENSPGGFACYDAILKAGAPGLSLTSKAGSPVAKASPGVSVFAMDVQVAQPPTTLHLEQHHWLLGNAIVNVVFTGPKDALTAEVVQTAIDKQKAAAEDAASGKRTASR
jgi:hypothetical protein